MKRIKASFFIAFLGIFLWGCKSSQVAVTAPNFDEIITTPAKKDFLSEEELKVWHHLDIQKDSIAGISLEKAYKFLKGKKARPVVIAIADSGVDINHEDLKDVLWVNKDEIKGNNKDDDNNGYIDDVFGWNFLGNSKGDIVTTDQLEITRIVKRGREKFGDKELSEVAEKDKKDYEEYLKLNKEFEATLIEKKGEIYQMDDYLKNLDMVQENFDIVKKLAKTDSLTLAIVDKVEAPNLQTLMRVKNVANILKQGMSESTLKEEKEKVKEYVAELKKAMEGYNLDMNYRQSLGDDLYDITDKFYGNNNMLGTADAGKHGTHVAGIVAANRTNKIGAVGVAGNVKIMTVRIVPEADEHDKDVALGIRYAVDNGAKIINTSFGKRFSPNKNWVYDALKYAAEKDVLIVNAAGNDGKDLDVNETYPTDSKDMLTEFTDNVITIGANSLHYDKNLPANFSNYGKVNVDIFAPGVSIYAPIPEDKYEALSGTSMAAPTTAGVAALVRSYYPNLSAKEVKDIIMRSGVKINFDVVKPGSQTEENPNGEMIPFSSLSVTGRVVNAYNALQLAEYISNKKQ